MTTRHLPLAMTAALVVMASTARAQDGVQVDEVQTETTTTTTEEVSRFGGAAPYVAIGGVYAIENNKSSLDSGIPGYGNLKNSGGYDIRAGYKFQKMVAAEIEWQSLVSFKADGVFPVTGNEAPNLEARMLSLNGRVSPLDGRIQPYGLIGMGWVNVQADRQSVSIRESAFGMRFGLGVLAYITERTGIALEAAYVLPMSGKLGGSDRFDIIPITASLFFRFK